MNRRRALWAGGVLVVALGAPLACGTQEADPGAAPTAEDATPSPTDATAGGPADGPIDARDALADAGPADAARDASDAAPDSADASKDASVDATPDAVVDAAPDVVVDAGPPAPVVFSVMGDVPYTAADDPTLQAQIVAHNLLSPSSFMVHVGDIKSGSTPCDQAVYLKVAGFLHALTVPTFIIPGDNEWNDCADPDTAWGCWTASFGRFESFWPTAPAAAHQAARDENFAWVERGVLFVGINLVGGRVHDAAEWAARLADDASWIEAQLALHGTSAYAMVLFAHAEPTANHAAFMTRYRAAAGAWGKPVLHLMGDGHVWRMDRPWAEQNILRVEVQQGGVAQPIQVTVSATAAEPFTIDRAPY